MSKLTENRFHLFPFSRFFTFLIPHEIVSIVEAGEED
jgi:hypothetical protein